MKLSRNQFAVAIAAIFILAGISFSELAVAAPLQCNLMARLCKDGSTAVPKGDGTCAQSCPEDKGRPNRLPLKCPMMARLCKDGSAAVPKGDGTCAQSCPEDKHPGLKRPDLKCPRIARLCKDGKPAQRAADSCKLICSEDKHICPDPAAPLCNPGEVIIMETVNGCPLPKCVKQVCKPVDCAAPPPFCHYTPEKDSSGCPTSCGPLVCEGQPAGTTGGSTPRSSPAR